MEVLKNVIHQNVNQKKKKKKKQNKNRESDHLWRACWRLTIPQGNGFPPVG